MSAMGSDYRLVCRTCLVAEAEFYKLNAPILTDADAEDDSEQRTTFLECLRYCTRLPDPPGFPIYICTECSSALQIAYQFMKNALQAHEILCQKLPQSAQLRRNGLHQNMPDKTPGVGLSHGESPMRFRCKVCGEKVESKKSLKEHVKLHLDMISYCCRKCDFESKKRSQLSEHYLHAHGIQPSREHLKANTRFPLAKVHSSTSEEAEELQHDEIASQMEAIHNAPTAHSECPFDAKEQEQQLAQRDLAAATVIQSGADAENTYSTHFQAFSQELSNEMSVGNEFIVMADGTVEKVMANGVVIEYINATDKGGGVLETNDVLQDLNMDVDDIIIEEENASPEVLTDKLQLVNELQPSQYTIEASVASSKTIQCKICAHHFSTQDSLKTHMLTHNEIPHFFCDRCPFYTFFKVDLMQHYKTQHHLEPTYKQLLPKNKVHTDSAGSGSSSGARARLSAGFSDTEVGSRYIYKCDLCVYETSSKINLRRHYMGKHMLNATEPQLCPTIVERDETPNNKSSLLKGADAVRNVRLVKPDYPNGLNCRKCNKTFYLRNKLKEHYRLHNIEENAGISARARLSEADIAATKSIKVYNTVHNEKTPTTSDSGATVPKNSNAYTVPLDAMPQVVEIDDIIDNAEIEFDFNQDELFDDFDEEENEDNEDEPDLLLTSDDDFEEILEEQTESKTDFPHPYCIHCNKKFISQYQFENHMFVHRGLAPYRCEMCTNLYNTKRALIRHYKAVHKKIPTRDMIQAKGDKVSVDKTPVEHLNLEEQTATTLMCAKCPYESTEFNNIKIHLKTSHGILDENYILRKLPFECPRCIRSYQTKGLLIRHLERSHSVATIIQQKQCPPLGGRPVAPAAAATVAASAVPDSRCGSTVEELRQVPSVSTNTNVNSYRSSSSSVPPAASVISSEVYVGAALIEVDIAAAATITSAGIQYLCNACDFSCRTLQDLDVHSQQHPKDETRDTFNFMCPICQCKYKSMLLLKYHLKRHTDRKFGCSECPKTYISRSELQNHKLTHTGETPFKCTVCGKQFRYPQHLRRHTNVQHLGERHVCPIPGCERKLTTSAQLKIHIWTHNGKVPYKCQYCDRSYKRRELLRQHAQKMHSVTLTEDDLADIYRNTVGHTNPHDFTVPSANGIMRRRHDAEASANHDLMTSFDNTEHIVKVELPQ